MCGRYLMQIFVMRHGEASFFADTDAERTLSEQGRLEAELMGKWMNKMTIAPDWLWVSPYVRAEQTSQAVLAMLAEKPAEIITQAMITPSGSAEQVRDLLDGELAVRSIDQLLIVSHMPLVSYLVAELTQQEHAPIFQTAGVAEINYNVDTMKGELVRIVSPIDLC